ncbi:MAG: hypothetical protein ACI97A_003800, partial [Planctomycetota bacterium]
MPTWTVEFAACSTLSTTFSLAIPVTRFPPLLRIWSPKNQETDHECDQGCTEKCVADTNTFKSTARATESVVKSHPDDGAQEHGCANET